MYIRFGGFGKNHLLSPDYRVSVNERDRIWVELYNSDELNRAAKSFFKSTIHEDLLSDAIIKVFDTRIDFIDLHKQGKLKDYVFITMRSMAYRRTERVNGEQWARHDKWAQRYGLGESTWDDLHVMQEEGAEPALPEDVTEDELKYSEGLFSQVTQLRIKLMRKIDEAEKKRELDPDLWESAQYIKLYLHHGTMRKVASLTGTGRKQVENYIRRFKEWASENQRMKITVVTKANEPQTGMELYRLHYPYFDGIATYHKDEFSVSKATYDYIDNQPKGTLESDVYVFSRVQKNESRIADKVLSEGKKVVLDLDDYWGLNAGHPLRNSPGNGDYVSTITGWMQKAHMVTTTSARLAERMKIEYDVDAVVIKNTIPDSAEQFKGDKYPSSLVRLLWIGGTHHIDDLELMRPGLRKLYGIPQVSGYQICLGGFNHNQHFLKYESVMTADNYLIRTDDDYKDYLEITKELNNPMLDHIGYNKPYRRLWAKSVSTYGEGYRQADAVFIPMVGGNLFNACKSELKLIEAGMTRTAAIVWDAPPYSDHIQHEVNCLKVDTKKQDLYTQARRMILDKDLREETADNLHEYVKKNFDHKKETNKLATALRKLK